ncbi:RimJ/RimL family protein N-acetyltransferase [Chitinivorax tropicus]|uniref:RimJ/RimL family protein N-acetyltransferase n=1 Tax=Chitinivorax tropicus TaxID=714531 RepID=A0A840MFZ3_9PROT|nr:GNAT family N-acetyltransferase [Chitinivorax tropicus]MBB5017578.1 RimJ/RimL family protein N-acetyltransferase [Chitinivorax tropicus]
MTIITRTERLILREFNLSDAPFILTLVNDPDWLNNIGDRHVHSIADAEQFLQRGPMASYAQHGFGLFAVEHQQGHSLLGMCGLIRRDSLPAVDIGYAFLPAHRGHGYAREAAQAMVGFARDTLKLSRLLGITSPDNQPSCRLLEAIGLSYQQDLVLPGEDELTSLYEIEFGSYPPIMS